MPLSIIIPEDANFIEKYLVHGVGRPQDGGEVDGDSLYHDLIKCMQRSLLFYEETFTGYIIHTSSLERVLPSKTVFLNLVSTYDIFSGVSMLRDPAQPVISVQLSPGLVETEDNTHKNESATVGTDVVWQGQSEITEGSRSNICIWKFTASAGSPQRETSGQIRMSVSFLSSSCTAQNNARLPSDVLQVIGPDPDQNPEPTRGMEYAYMRLDNLLEELNHSLLDNTRCNYELYLSKEQPSPGVRIAPGRETNESAREIEKPLPHTEDSDEYASLDVATSAALLLKLRTTKLGGRSDLLLTTLRIEAPDLMVNFARSQHGQYAIHILALNARINGGEITQLGEVPLPHRHTLEDVLNVTYKLVNNESLGISGDALEYLSHGPATSKPVEINICVRLEKRVLAKDVPGDAEWMRTTGDIATTWTPILEFESGPQPPGLSTKTHSPQSRSQLQFRSKSSHLKPLQLFVNNPKRPVDLKRHAGSTASPGTSPGAFLLYSPRMGWQGNMSPRIMRPMTPSKSSPMLPMSRGGVTRKKTPQVMFAANGMSGITVNLASENGSMLSGLRLTFTGSTRIALGQTTTWKVQAVNQTNRVLKLALVMTSPTKKTHAYHQSLGLYNSFVRSSSNHTLPGSDDKKMGTGPFIQNRLLLYEQYIASKPEETGVVLLSNDVALGVLESNQVFESEFQFISFSKGVFNLTGLRVAESTTGDTFDVGRFLEVYVT